MTQDDQAQPEFEDEDEATSQSLLKNAVAQDDMAWRMMWVRYLPLIKRWCRRRGLQEAEQDSIGQEVIVAVHRKLPEFRHAGRVGAFRKWLKVITENKLNDYFRDLGRRPRAMGGNESQQKWEQMPDADRDSDAPSASKQQLANEALEIAQREFSAVHWQAFVLTVVQQRDAGDVAGELKMTRSALYMARSRILKYLRREMQQFYEDEAARDDS